MWFSDDININEDYRTRVMAYYDAEISEINFTKPSSLELINSWGNLKSNGVFEKLIEIPPSPNTDIFLINAFSLNSGWKDNNISFLSKSNFYPDNGDTLKINTINWDGMNVRLNENENYSFLQIPLENDQFFLSVVEPENAESMVDFIEAFTIDELNHQTENALEFRANINLPKINFSTDKQFKSTLSNMGLNALFLSTTDLSPSFIEKNKHISEVKHKAKISFNTPTSHFAEEATFTDSNLKLISINKPFLYFVRDKHTQTVLFAGYFSN